MAFIRRIVHRHMQIVAAAGGIGVFVASFYPQTLGLGQYRRVMQMYKDGQPWPVDDKLLSLLDKLIPVVGIKPKEEVDLEFFTVYGHNPVHKGSVKLKTGATIGIPGYWAHTGVEDVHQSKMEVRGEAVDWDSEGGKMLQTALVLSDKAKAFALAREMCYIQQQQGMIGSFLKSATLVVFYGIGFTANHLFQLKVTFKPWARVGLYSLIGLLGVGTAFGLEDIYFLRCDRKADLRAARLGPYFTEGGLEFYEKVMLKNKALRLLMGRQGAKYYTKQGLDIIKWRYDHMPETLRLLTIQEVLDKQQEEKEKERKKLEKEQSNVTEQS